MRNDVLKTLLTADELQARCKELGEQITKDYAGKTPILVFGSFVLKYRKWLRCPR